jgi:xanthine dehydrogenase YagR molybdenum-binding subunit
VSKQDEGPATGAHRPITGAGIDRVEGKLKVTGKAAYPSETAVANVAHAVIVSSTIGLGRLTGMDVAAAERSPGVLAVLTPRNAPRLPGATKKQEDNDRRLQLLQDDAIAYNDQPIALVVADTLENARRGASLVRPAYEEHRPAVQLGAPPPQDYAPRPGGGSTNSSPTDSSKGDPEKGRAAAAARVDATYTTPFENHNPMEPHGTIAVWQGNDRLTVYDSTQGIFSVRKKLAAVFGLEPEQVRVISLYVGGGFGCKGSPWSHIPLAAMAARVVGRPVKLVLSRHQMFSLVGFRPTTRQRLRLAADGHGRLTAIEHDLGSVTSRYDEFVEWSARPSRMLYACPNIRTTHRLTRLDISTPTFMRAPGESTGNFALESAMDELSYALEVDPLELRLRNYAENSPDGGKPWGSKALRACYQQAAARFGWQQRRPAVRAMRDGHQLIGWGMATACYPAQVGEAKARARIRADGSAVVQSGSQDIGTGTYTIMTQLAADALALPVHRVRFELGDTSYPETPVSGGSKTAATVGSAVNGAALALRTRLAELAVADQHSPLHGLQAGELEALDGALVARGTPGRRDPYGEIVRRSGQPEVVVEYESKVKDDRKKFAHYAFGAQFAEVRVDEDLGQVQVSRMVSAFAAGRILNAKTARSQLIGGIVWGIGMALMEQTVRDPRNGRVMSRDLADYHVPVNRDVPAIDVIMVEEHDPHVNDIGVKGVGEIGITGAPAAIASAVYHATGKRVRDLPITLDKLL